MMNKTNVSIVFFLVVCIEIAAICMVSKQFDHVIPYDRYIQGITILSILYITSIRYYRGKSLMWLVLTSFSILLLMPIYMYFQMPKYTYSQAQDLIETKENLPVVDAHNKTMVEDGENRYFIRGEHDGERPKFFLFNPHTGDYHEISYEMQGESDG